MSEDYGAVNVKCPFYCEESKNSIKCEGIISTTCKHNFETSLQKKKHKEKYCNRDFMSCPCYGEIKIKYS